MIVGSGRAQVIGGLWRTAVASVPTFLLASVALVCVVIAALAVLVDEHMAYYAALAAALFSFMLVGLVLYAEYRRRQLLRVVDILEELTAWISHEYTNSATRMGMHTRILREDADALGEPGHGALVALERERESMRGSTDAILRLTRTKLLRMRVGAEEREIRSLNLSALLDETVDLVEWRAAEKRITLVPVLEAARIVGDAGMIVVMALNLIENAVKYTPPGGRVEVGCRVEGGTAYFSVEDSGPGIPEAMRERIFLPGQRLSDTESERGSGFGLALVREIVSLHKGTIAVGVGALGGAAFRLRFTALK